MSGAGNLIILSAPSGAGKTTLAYRAIERLQRDGIEAGFSVSYTTRAPRPGEHDGRDYHFVSDAEFLRMVDAGEMLEHAEVFGRRYGTGRAATEQALSVGRSLFLDIDWQGAAQIRGTSLPGCVSVFILPPSRAALRQRLTDRAQDDAATIAARMREATAEMSHYSEFDYLIVNQDLDRATDELHAICRAARQQCGLQGQRHRNLLAELLEVEA